MTLNRFVLITSAAMMLSSSLFAIQTFAFFNPLPLYPIDSRSHHSTVRLGMQQQDETNDELDELSPPSISFTKNSILFGDNPPTEKDNGPLFLWRQTKSILPNVVTGAYKAGDGDRNPVGHLYNLLFVRMPVVLMGIVYINNLIRGHPLYMSFGQPFEVPTIIVLGVLYIILR